MKNWIINKETTNSGNETIQLSNTYFFHYSHDLKFTSGKSILGNTFIIIGTVTSCSNEYQDVELILRNGSLKEFLEAKKYWGGRWIIFFNGVLYTDFCCVYGVFWHRKTNTVSNTFDVFELLNIDTINFEISNKYYLNWVVTPKTPFNDVYKLMPGTGLNFSEKSIELLDLDYAKDLNLPEKEVVASLSNCLRIESKSIQSKFKQVYVALSAGYDSRLIYSVFTSQDIKIKTYTHLFSSMSLEDAKIPARVNPENIKIFPKKYDAKKSLKFTNRIKNTVSDADKGFYSRGQWDFLREDEVVVRGGVLELAGLSSAHLEGRFENFGESSADGKLFLYALKDFRQAQHDSMADYINLYLKRNSNIRWSKQLYIDQRIAGWLSYIELGLDLIKGTSIHLGNSEYMINLMLSQSLKNMKIKSFHLDEMRSNKPDLLKIPFTDKSLSSKIKRIFSIQISKIFGEIIGARIFH